jgi:hypothetical protein
LAHFSAARTERVRVFHKGGGRQRALRPAGIDIDVVAGAGDQGALLARHAGCRGIDVFAGDEAEVAGGADLAADVLALGEAGVVALVACGVDAVELGDRVQVDVVSGLQLGAALALDDAGAGSNLVIKRPPATMQ